MRESVSLVWRPGGAPWRQASEPPQVLESQSSWVASRECDGVAGPEIMYLSGKQGNSIPRASYNTKGLVNSSLRQSESFCQEEGQVFSANPSSTSLFLSHATAPSRGSATQVRIELQSENGLLGIGPYPTEAQADEDVVACICSWFFAHHDPEPFLN